MSVQKLLNAIGFEDFFTGRILPLALLAAASIGLASAQTPFMIVSVNSAEVLEVPIFPKSPGQEVQQFPMNGGTNQQWTLQRVSANSELCYGEELCYEIRSVSSGMALTVNGASTTPGDSIKSGLPVQQEPPVGAANQLWTLYRASGSTGFEILAVNTEVSSYVALDVPHSSTIPIAVQEYTENNGTNQQWIFMPQVSRGISLSVAGATLKINGYGFQAGTEACTVIGYPPATPACTTVLANGSFSYTLPPAPRTYYDSSLAGYTVVIVEDKNANVLAVGSIAGGFQIEPIQVR